jgi:hypothetical protein
MAITVKDMEYTYFSEVTKYDSQPFVSPGSRHYGGALAAVVLACATVLLGSGPAHIGVTRPLNTVASSAPNGPDNTVWE